MRRTRNRPVRDDKFAGHGRSDDRTGRDAAVLVAKRCADDYLERSPLEATILRPTALTDDEGTGQVSSTFESRGEDGDEIPRADVAQAAVACLENEETIGETIGLFGGETPVEEAIRSDG
ncbi:NAD(P)H-binding protein [Natronobacterium texcoconense]|uniref:NAD(P)H-binding protein n=1 Tax=Natronobacterium texcoconense TaxID=1095778 RepID=UPI001BA482DD